MESFTWIDGERLIRFGRGALDEAPALLERRGFAGYALLTTERATAAAPELASAAAVVLDVPPGPVPDVAAAVLGGVGDRPIVALGGGRVVDAAKAVAGHEALPCAAVPTTLAGSPMTPFHRLPARTRGGQLVRPSLVVWDPRLTASLPRPQLTATALNALAHAFESLYVPHANPVAEMAALRAAALFATRLPDAGSLTGGAAAGSDPAASGAGSALADDAVADVALAALLAGYAVGTTGLAVHHALCQTTVRSAGLPHAQVNAVMLPHTAGLMATRAPETVGRFARALGDPDGDPAQAPRLIAALGAGTGIDGLGDLGLDQDAIPGIAHAAIGHPALGNTPGGAPSEAELAELLRAAL